jgi:hypothetical protein
MAWSSSSPTPSTVQQTGYATPWHPEAADYSGSTQLNFRAVSSSELNWMAARGEVT